MLFDAGSAACSGHQHVSCFQHAAGHLPQQVWQLSNGPKCLASPARHPKDLHSHLLHWCSNADGNGVAWHQHLQHWRTCRQPAKACRSQLCWQEPGPLAVP